MPNLDQDVNRSEERSSSAGAVLGINFVLSEKVLMGLISLSLTFLSGVACSHLLRTQTTTENVITQPTDQYESPVQGLPER